MDARRPTVALRRQRKPPDGCSFLTAREATARTPATNPQVSRVRPISPLSPRQKYCSRLDASSRQAAPTGEPSPLTVLAPRSASSTTRGLGPADGVCPWIYGPRLPRRCERGAGSLPAAKTVSIFGGPHYRGRKDARQAELCLYIKRGTRRVVCPSLFLGAGLISFVTIPHALVAISMIADKTVGSLYRQRARFANHLGAKRISGKLL